MASFLASLGIKGTETPDPSAYANQQQEAANLADARSSLSSTTAAIQIALSVAQAAGAPTQTLSDLNTQVSTLASTNLTSAQLAAQINSVNTKLAAAAVTNAAAIKEQAISDMISAINIIEERVNIIRADKTTTSDLLNKYNTLLKSANQALNALQNPPVDVSGTTPPTYPAPDSLLSTLDDLDTLKDAEENATFNMERFFKRIFNKTMYYCVIVFIALGALLGGIIMSNAYASDIFWGIKLYYFVYGAAFFPLSLVYGAIKYPYWVSGLIPLYSLDGVIDPSSSSLVDSLFGYRLVTSDPKKIKKSGTPEGIIAAEQLSSRTTLWILSLVEIVILSGFTIYYGVDKLILKNQIQ